MSGLEVNIETQTFRAIPSERVEIDEAVKFANARSNGEFAVIEHQDPHALIVIDKDGSILIHGISNLEAASLIAKEILLQNWSFREGSSARKWRGTSQLLHREGCSYRIGC